MNHRLRLFFNTIALCFFLCPLFLISPMHTQASTVATTAIKNKSDIEIQKLNQETEKLKNESEKLKVETEKIKREKRSLYWSPILQMITSVIGICSLLITYYATRNAHKNTINSLNIQSEKNEKDRISGMLKELGSDSTPVRLGAVQALGEYEVSIRYLINVIKFDSIPEVREAAAVALQQFPEQVIPLLAEESRLLHDRQLELAARHFIHEKNRDMLVNFFKLDEYEWSNWHKSFYSTFREEKISQWSYEQYAENMNEYAVKKRDLQRIVEEWLKCHTAIKEIVRTLGKVLSARKISMEKNSSNKLNINNAYLPDLIIEQGTIEDVVFNNCILYRSSFKGTKLKNVQFLSCDLSYINFINASMFETQMNDCRMTKTIFTKSTLHTSLFEKCEGIGVRFNGAVLEGVVIRNCTWKKSLFYGVKASYMIFSDNTKFYDCTLGGEWRGLDIQLTEFGGGRFDEMYVERSTFIECAMKGLEWKGGKFVGLSWKNCLIECTPVTKALLVEKVFLDNCNFGYQTDELKKYLEDGIVLVESPTNKWWLSMFGRKYSPPS
ncbi:pentapeptide repeat-containing protein [Paenibacillus sp. FSL P2-0121]|uniref:pentapeptide repeat-containing protein n=1 Tax=Paenibacillus sp. FSL P2-0121 TaxID=2921626 RepID=UPI0030D1BD8A